MCPSLSLWLSLSFYPSSLFVSLSVSVSVSVFDVCLCLNLSVSFCLCLSLSDSVCLCLSLSLNVCISVCLSLRSFFFSISFFLSFNLFTHRPNTLVPSSSIFFCLFSSVSMSVYQLSSRTALSPSEYKASYSIPIEDRTSKDDAALHKDGCTYIKANITHSCQRR